MKPEDVPTQSFIASLEADNPEAFATLQKCPAFHLLWPSLDMTQMCDLLNLYQDLKEQK